MKKSIYAIHDSKVKAYLQPFFMRTHGEAIRSFGEICSDEKSQFNKYPEDFAMLHIGDWDEETGTVTKVEKTPLSKATDFITK